MSYYLWNHNFDVLIMVCSRESLIIVVLIMVMSAHYSCAQNKSVVCVDSQGTVAEKARMAALQSTFEGSYLRPLDLIFVVDRSNSIGDVEFNQTKELMNTLISFLSERKYIFINKENTRVAVISFGMQAISEFDGVNVDEQGYIDACILGERITALQSHNADTAGSEVAQGISRAHELFSISRSKHGRADAKQILWVFFDGAEGNHSRYQGKQANVWAADLRQSGVKVFAVGVGAWLHISRERELRVVELASSQDYYSCVGTWLRILEQTPITQTTGDDSDETDGPVYNEIAEAYSSECGLCPSGLVCACDVTNKEYSCADDNRITRINVESTVDRPDNHWLLPVAIASGAFGFILLLILLIVVPVLAKKKREERRRDDMFFESQPIYGGPALPPPPRRRRQRNESTQREGHDNIYGNYGNHAELSRMGSTTSQSSSEAGSEIKGIVQYQDIDYPHTTIQFDYENVDAQLDQDMKGWPEYLFDMKNDKKLLHLAIRSIPTKRWAITPGFGILESEVREMEKVMRDGQEYKAKKIKIVGKTFDLDPDELSELHIHAIRDNRRGDRECAWISKVYDYVIVGIANVSEDEACTQGVYEIHRHLHQLIQSSDSVNVTANNDRNYELTLHRMSARFSVREGRP